MSHLIPFMTHQHTYQKKDHQRTVVLHSFQADWIEGKLMHLDCQDTRWITLDEIDNYCFVSGDLPILHRLKTIEFSRKN